MKLKILFETEHTSEVIVDDILFRTALNDTQNSKGRWINAIENDVNLTIVSHDRNLDAEIKRGFYTLEDVAEDWVNTRELIRLRHGDPVILFRANLPAHKHNPQALTLYYGDRALAMRFMTDERELIEKQVNVDDIIALYANKNGYYEFIVKII